MKLGKYHIGIMDMLSSYKIPNMWNITKNSKFHYKSLKYLVYLQTPKNMYDLWIEIPYWFRRAK